MRVIAFILSVILLGFTEGQQQQPSLQTESKCEFYCLLQPHPQQPIIVDHYRNLSCTHMVYGPADIGTNLELQNPSSYDLSEIMTIGNYARLLQFRSFPNPPQKIYLGVRSDREMHMLSTKWTQSVVIKNILSHLKEHHFDGFLLFTDGSTTWTQELKSFLQSFRTKQKESNQTVDILLTLPARLIGKSRTILREIEPLIEGIYLMTDDTSATENPSLAVSVDPLRKSSHVPEEDSIEENTALLVYNGFPEEKIIVGLSSWTRSYILPEGVKEAHHGSKIAGLGKGGQTTRRTDGKLAYREICKLTSNVQSSNYDNETETFSFVRDGVWYSAVLPDHPSFKNKLKWMGEQNFKGVGITSLFSDDHDGQCGRGIYPIHRTIAEEYKCKIRRKKRDTRGSCIRMCSFQPTAAEIFDYKNFEPHFCSHIILLSAELLANGGIRAGETVRKNIQAYEAWAVTAKPLLILSVGDSQEKDVWRFALGSPSRRTVTVRSIQQAIKEFDLDGVDISWTLSSPENAWDANNLGLFLAELKLGIPHKQLIASITPQFSYNYHIKAESIGQSVDYFLLQGYKFHAYNHLFTGHHSPLFSNSEILADPKMTLEGLSFDWVSRGIPGWKLIIGFSAEGMSMIFQNVRTGNEIGAPANVFRNTQVQRAGNGGSVSQSEICKTLRDNQTRNVFIEELGVPYMTQNDLFIAYDNERSMRAKAIWAALNNFGGVGLHAIEMDNIHGECPEGRPYPMLKALINSQVCDYCHSNGGAISSSNSNGTKKEEEQCDVDFQVACSYNLPKDNTTLSIENIPFDDCTEIVIEEGGLTANGKVAFNGETSDENLKQLSKMALENGKKPLIASIQCQMRDTEFTDLMKDPSSAITEINNMVKAYQLQGVEIKCDGQISPHNKDNFSKFLEKLKTTLNQEKQTSCPITISLRVPIWNTRLNETYNIDLLNSLHHVALEAFQTSSGSAQLVSPMFSTSNDDQTAIDATISKWLEQGVNRDVLILHIPGYGVLQHLSPSQQLRHDVGDNVQKNFFEILSRKDICLKLAENSVSPKFIYDNVAAYSITPGNEWISYENQASITYKIKYVTREGLAGVGLKALNDDDSEGICKEGKFPLLHTINRNRCSV